MMEGNIHCDCKAERRGGKYVESDNNVYLPFVLLCRRAALRYRSVSLAEPSHNVKISESPSNDEGHHTAKASHDLSAQTVYQSRNGNRLHFGRVITLH